MTIPLTILITVLVAKRSQKLFVAQWKSTGILNARVEETFSGHSIVKVFGHQKEVEARLPRRERRGVHARASAPSSSRASIMPAMMFIGNLVYVAIAVVGGLQVAAGLLSIGDVQAFIQYSRQFTQPLSQLGSMANLLQSGVASAERVFELLDEDRGGAATTPTPRSAPESASHLAFEDVAFRYSPDKPLIEELSLDGEAREHRRDRRPDRRRQDDARESHHAVLRRRQRADHARRRRHDCRMTRDDLRSRTGMVLQDTWLFAGTIRENIAYGRPDATEEEIVAAATAAYVDRFVHALPDGYDTMLDDEATNLSVGERQLITIARAFLADPRILILDEATSIGRHAHRAAHPARDVAAARGPHGLRHRAPALDDPGCRPHPRDGERRDRRAGLARRAARARRAPTGGCTTRSSRRRSTTEVPDAGSSRGAVRRARRTAAHARPCGGAAEGARRNATSM